MAESFFDRIRQRFPQLDDLADQRFQARGHTTLLNTKTRKPLPGLTEELVFYCLLLLKTITENAGFNFELTIEEEKFLSRYKVTVKRRQ